MLKVSLIAHTPEPEKVVAAAAKLCYSNAHIDDLLDGLTPEKSADFVRMLARMGHESPTEHASFTFAIEGVSFSVQSQRYVRLDQFEYVTPPAVEEDPEGLAAFEQAMAEEAEHYRRIAAVLKEGHIRQLVAQGMDEEKAAKKAEKMAIEDARFVLPNACTTKMIVTMNARSLQNFFHHRCCNRAQWEIRELAEQMFKLVYEVAPALFATAGPSCVVGPCPEGKMSCGRADEVRAHYAALKEGVNQ